ncbi:helix-turn-helix domain-containing protein [Bacillus sp. PS06]|uniref:helix-turn-helix domain-containing protein n=1 Tax=Bacillus sp. PS06 TaxID=2764176 RepID=UPI00177FD50F|nr:XRE family transcriptional regulator [Bacillus sp. PS06]MBD8071422.1 XRE family transcriptional regulator [Bacillus sp. PS06]
MDNEVIKFIRMNYNMTQREFAKVLNCSFSLIALVEVGKRRVTENLENKVKSTFNLDEKQLESIILAIKESSKGFQQYL